MTPQINVTRLDNISLMRSGNDSVKISWKIKDKPSQVAIFLGESPDEIDHHCPAVVVKGKSDAIISGLDPETRYYFEVAADCAPKMIISERRVPLEGSVNFRDLGGYQTVDGQRVKWGRVFRSDNLGRLTDRDVVFLRRMGIRLVFDFRTPAEVKKLPDRFPTGDQGQYLHLPIQQGEFDPVNAFERIKNGDHEWLTEEFMIESYIRNIENVAPVWATFFNRLADRSNRPLVFHCTGGKDRAGVCAALVLLVLGVPEETVIKDHGLSNMYIAGVLKTIYAQIRSLGVDPENVAPYFTAPKSAIVALLKHIRKTYGSAANYLKTKAEVDQKVLNQLQAALLA